MPMLVVVAMMIVLELTVKAAAAGLSIGVRGQSARTASPRLRLPVLLTKGGGLRRHQKVDFHFPGVFFFFSSFSGPFSAFLCFSCMFFFSPSISFFFSLEFLWVGVGAIFDIVNACWLGK